MSFERYINAIRFCSLLHQLETTFLLRGSCTRGARELARLKQPVPIGSTRDAIVFDSAISQGHFHGFFDVCRHIDLRAFFDKAGVQFI